MVWFFVLLIILHRKNTILQSCWLIHLANFFGSWLRMALMWMLIHHMLRWKSWRCACHYYCLPLVSFTSLCLRARQCRFCSSIFHSPSACFPLPPSLLKCLFFFFQANDLIATLDLDDPSSVRRAEPFHGSFPKLGPPTAISGKVHQKFAASVNYAHNILAGYEHNINEIGLYFLEFYVISICFQVFSPLSSSSSTKEYQFHSLWHTHYPVFLKNNFFPSCKIV